MTYYAHSKEGNRVEQWQLLEAHLRNVSNLAADFASEFNAADWGRIAGLVHDAGKYSHAFQAYIRRENGIDAPDFRSAYQGRSPHAIQGARHLMKVGPKQIAPLFAYLVAGHHRGLQDGSGGSIALKTQLDETTCQYDAPVANLPDFLHKILLPTAPPIQLPKSRAEIKRAGFQIAMLIRMLFSCLTDADFLDTESFMDPEKHGSRTGYPDFQQMTERFQREMAALIALRKRVKSGACDLMASHTSFKLDACERWAYSSVTTCDQGVNVRACLSTPCCFASFATK